VGFSKAAGHRFLNIYFRRHSKMIPTPKWSYEKLTASLREQLSEA
jgi:hypothetical protein